tara:strand:+ start:9815 stop:9925 length:111 start_codon:yes stop_codon:yes gene_type:complete
MAMLMIAMFRKKIKVKPSSTKKADGVVLKYSMNSII